MAPEGHRPGRTAREVDAKEFAAAHNAGMSQAQLAAKFGIGKHRVARVLDEIGEPRHPKGFQNGWGHMTCPNCGEHIDPPPGEIITFGRLTLDTESREVFVDGERRDIGGVNNRGEPCPGRGKEFTVLEYMVRNAGRVVRREALLNRTDTWDADPKIADVWICSIRKGIGDVVEIRCKHGVGWWVPAATRGRA